MLPFFDSGILPAIDFIGSKPLVGVSLNPLVIMSLITFASKVGIMFHLALIVSSSASFSLRSSTSLDLDCSASNRCSAFGLSRSFPSFHFPYFSGAIPSRSTHRCFMCIYMQQVYMYFRGSGKAAEMKKEAARGAMRAAF